MPTTDKNPLATRPIGKLIASYAIPSIIAMLVNSLYNIVDQIFIGHGVGYLGNAATTIAFPVITIGLAIALIFGNGCAAYISLKLGQKDIKDANHALGSAVSMSAIIAVAFAIVSFVLIDPLLNALGATPNIYQHSYDYVSIILIGQPFVILSTVLSNVIRADGSPKYSMMCMLVGAILNTILDPIFIFVFDMGVSGAAIATVISQVVSFIVSLAYYKKRSKNVHLMRRNLRPNMQLVRTVTALGFSSFVTQMAVTIVNIAFNNMLRHYGGLSAYGSEIPLSAMGIVLKVNGILISVIIGIAVGAQPILGYNYGARHYTRVRQTYLRSILIATIVAVGAWAVCMAVPDALIRAFGDNEPMFVEFGVLGFRIYIFAVFTAGFQIVSSSYFQAIGRPGKAAFLSMSRQIIFLIPLMLIMAYAMGLMGILYAGPIADVSAAAVTFLFILHEMRRLKRMTAEGLEQPV